MNEEIKKEARELVEKYKETIMSFLGENMKYENAKKCAIIDTQNTIDMLNNVLYYDNEDSDLTSHIIAKLHQKTYVKQAIEQL